MERFLPDMKLNGPIDMKFGPDGDLYVLEYGNAYFKDNPEAELIRIEYNSGNRKPLVEASVNKTAGALPLQITLSSFGTKDYDEDEALQYEWVITKNKLAYKTLKEANPSITLTSAGTYQATLTVTDKLGEKNAKSVEIVAGNEPPVVKFKITKGNSTFFFPGKSVHYNVSVSDREDGSLANGKIRPSQVSVSTDYLSEGFNLTRIAQRQISIDASAQYATAIYQINNRDCKACHAINEKVLGPSFKDVSKRYKNDPSALASLSKKIINGGSGNWGDAYMPAHTAMQESDVRGIVKYILSLADTPKSAKTLPVKGTVTTIVPKASSEGTFIFRAAYTDRGANSAPSQSSQITVILRNPLLPVSHANQTHKLSFNDDSTSALINESGAFLKFERIDLTNIKKIIILGVPDQNGNILHSGNIEVRANAVNGIFLGKFSGKYSDKMVLNVANHAASGLKSIYFVFNGAPVTIKAIKFGQGD